MPFPSAGPARPVLLLLLSCLPLQATAADTAVITRFDLRIEHTAQRWRTAGTPDGERSRLTRVRAVWEETLGPRLRGHLHLAYLALSRDTPGYPYASRSTGYGGGIGFELRMAASHAAWLALFLDTDYFDTRGENDAGVTERNGWEARGGLHLSVFPHHRWHLFAGAGYQALWGEERFTGTGADRLQRFELDAPLFYYGGIRLALDRGGFASLRLDGGNRSGGQIVLGRRF